MKSANNRYQEILENALDGFWIVDVQGLIRVTNQAYIDMSGYTREEITTMKIYDFEARESKSETEKHIEKVFKQGWDRFETLHKRKDGSFFDVEISVKIINNEAICSLKDITLQKRYLNLTTGRLKISERAMTSTVHETLQLTLDIAENLTESMVSFFHFYNEDQQKVSLSAWSSRTIQQHCSINPKDKHYPLDSAGIWAECIRQRKEVIHNQLHTTDFKNPLPPGHTPLTRELTLPLFHKDKIVAVIGLGNKRQLYTQNDIDIIKDLAYFVLDLVQRKKAEEDLRILNEKLEQKVINRTRELEISQEVMRNFIDNSPMVFFQKGDDGKYQLVNRRFLDLFHQTEEGVKEKTDYDIFPKEMADQFVKNDKEVRNTGKLIISEEIVPQDDGIHTYLSYKFPISLGTGEKISVAGLALDITDRRKAQDALIDKEAKYRKLSQELTIIIDSIPGLVFYKDTQNNFIKVNQYMADAHKMPKYELDGKNLFDLYPHDLAQLYWDDDLEVIRSGQAKRNILEPWETETGTRWVLTNKIPYFDLEGVPQGIIGISMDITERKEIEDELQRANQALRQSNEDLDDFAYITSHDLKEPLRGISSFSQFLLEDYQEKLDAEGVQKLETLMKLSRRMEDLLTTLLNYSRVGRQEMAFGMNDIGRMLSEIKDTYSSYLEENHAELIIPEDLPSIYCDHTRLREVFTNLIINGVKYNDNPKKSIVVGYQEINGRNTFFVKDNGIGIEEQHFEKIFHIFRRLHGRDKYSGGTGAGLTIVKKIIERHQGKIWLESKPGKGSTFYFTLNKKENL